MCFPLVRAIQVFWHVCVLPFCFFSPTCLCHMRTCCTLVHACRTRAACMLHTCCPDVACTMHTFCTHVAQMLPACCAHVACMLPACCTCIARMLHTCCAHVAHVLRACYTHVARMLHAHCLHGAHVFHTCCNHVTRTLHAHYAVSVAYVFECVCTCAHTSGMHCIYIGRSHAQLCESFQHISVLSCLLAAVFQHLDFTALAIASFH